MTDKAQMPDEIYISDINGSRCRCWNSPVYGGENGEGELAVKYIRADLATPQAALQQEGDEISSLYYDKNRDGDLWHHPMMNALMTILSRDGYTPMSKHTQICLVKAALKAAQPVPRTGVVWQDIETAPKDGATKIICDRPAYKTYAVAISEKDGGVLEPVHASAWTPTHWMPLPAPPHGHIRTDEVGLLTEIAKLYLIDIPPIIFDPVRDKAIEMFGRDTWNKALKTITSAAKERE